VEDRALAFDVFVTLLDWRSTIASAFQESGLSPDPEELTDDCEPAALAATQGVDQKQRSWGPFGGLHEITLGELLDERGLELENEGRAALVRVWHQLDPWPVCQPGSKRWLGACLSNRNRSEIRRFRGYKNVSEGPGRAGEGLTERHVSPSTITDPRS
jgi:2-haloacid dehalogenase